MMNALIKLLCFLLAMLVSASAWSATYVYAGPPYTTVGGIYTTSMRITGSFTTANPLPPNLSNVEIGPYGQNLVTSWSFNNGVTTFTTANSSIALPRWTGVYGDFVVSTDVAGNITGFLISLQSPPSDSFNVDLATIRIGNSPVLYNSYNVPAACNTEVIFMCAGPGQFSVGAASTAGGFTTVQVTNVPTLSPGGVLLLVGLLAIAVGFGTRRKSN